MLPTARTSTSISGSTAHTLGSPASAHQASLAVQPACANSLARPPSAAAATLGHSLGSFEGIGSFGPWNASESPRTSRVGPGVVTSPAGSCATADHAPDPGSAGDAD